MVQRKFEDVIKASKTSKLFQSQSNILARNNLVIDLKANKASGVKSRTATSLGQAVHPTTSADINILSVLNAAATTGSFTGKQLIRKLHELAKKRPDDVGIILTIVQLKLENDETGSALHVVQTFLDQLEKFEEVHAKDARFSPASWRSPRPYTEPRDERRAPKPSW